MLKPYSYELMYAAALSASKELIGGDLLAAVTRESRMWYDAEVGRFKLLHDVG